MKTPLNPLRKIHRMTSHALCLFAGIAMALSASANDGPNLVPTEPASAPNYWCTWYAQNYWIQRGSDLDSLAGLTNKTAREEINYEANPLLMTATTLRRTHDILKQVQQQPEYRAVLNVQDDCNTAVGLGVLVASKRHPNMGERTYKGRDLPVAGPAFTPQIEIPGSAKAARVVASNGYRGTARVKAHPYGRKIMAAASAPGPSFALRQLPEPILSGEMSIRWKMQAANRGAATRNGFIVLSSDEDAVASLFAGAWTASEKLSLFEGITQFRDATLKPFKPGQELNCQLDLDLDTRTATLTINSVTQQLTLSEGVTGIHYIGFGVRGATTLFTEPKIIVQ